MEIGRINSITNSNKIDSIKSQASDDSFERRLKSAFDKNDEKQLKQVCKEFESVFLNMMYKQMKATVIKSELIQSDTGRDIFDSMLDDKLMEDASEGKGIGLSDVLYKQLSKQLKSTYKSAGGEGSGEVAE